MSTPGELLGALGREARARFGVRGQGVRVFRGRSVEELIPQIQRELGAEAIIVRRRDGLTGGVLGFFQHPFVEIEALPGTPGIDVYDESTDAAPPPQAPPVPTAPLAAAPPQADVGAYASAGAYEPPAWQASPQPPQLDPRQGDPAQFVTPPPAPPTPPAAPTLPPRPMLGYVPAPVPVAPPLGAAAPSATPSPLQAPAQTTLQPGGGAGSAYVTAHLAALARASRSRAAARVPAPAPPEPREQPTPTSWTPAFQQPRTAETREPLPPPPPPEPAPAAPPPWSVGERREVAPGSYSRARAGVARSLKRCGIGEELIDGACAHALALAPRAGLAQAVRATLAQRIPVAPPLPTKGAAIVVVGAGGSGKTTCCAALLGAYRSGSTLPASFATITREAKRDELRMLLSPHVMKAASARSPRALRALRRARTDGMAVIDTPGLSPADRAGVRELAHLLVEMEPERVVVALPATLSATAAAQLLQALRPLGANSLAVTHADETDQIGVAVEAACRFGLAPEYMLERARGGGWRVRQIAPTALAERLLP